MSNGMPYDSDMGRNAAAAITALMTGRAYAQSARIASVLGPMSVIPRYREPHNAVMRMHRDAAYVIAEDERTDGELLAATRRAWDEAVELGESYGYRNAQQVFLAPYGHDLVPDWTVTRPASSPTSTLVSSRASRRRPD